MAATRSANRGDPQRLRTLIPLESLGDESFERVAGSMTLRRVKTGALLFQLGKRNRYSLYLLDGCVELAAAGERRQVEGGSERARRPLADARPNRYSGTAVTDCTVAVIEAAVLDKYLTWDQMLHKPVPGYELQEFEGTADVGWMLQMLQTRVFARLPTANVQALFAKFEEVPVSAGQTVVNQGDPGNHYYIIKEGRCRVTRHAEARTPGTTLAELGPGNAFGEEALLSREPRNATVTMLSDGVIMRLAKDDFHTLMTEPLINRIDGAQMTAMKREGAIVLDVRLESEFRYGSIEGAHNVPLYLLRVKAAALDPALRYIVLCDTGARSAAAAFLLSERGLDVSLLDGGLAALAVPGGTENGSTQGRPGRRG